MTDIETLNGWTYCNRCMVTLAQGEPEEVVADIIVMHEREEHHDGDEPGFMEHTDRVAAS